MTELIIQAEDTDIQIIKPVLERMHIQTKKVDPNEEISDQILIDFLEKRNITFLGENLHSEVSDNEITFRKAFMEYVIRNDIIHTSVNDIIDKTVNHQIEQEGLLSNDEILDDKAQSKLDQYIKDHSNQ